MSAIHTNVLQSAATHIFSYKTKVYGESRPIAYDPFLTTFDLGLAKPSTGVRYNIAGGKDLKAILILHEYVAYLLFPLIIFLGYHFFPFFYRIIFGAPGLEEEHMERFAREWKQEELDYQYIMTMWHPPVGNGRYLSQIQPYRTRPETNAWRFDYGLDYSYCEMDEDLELCFLWVPTVAVICIGKLSLTALYCTGWTPNMYLTKVEVIAKQWSWLWFVRMQCGHISLLLFSIKLRILAGLHRQVWE